MHNSWRKVRIVEYGIISIIIFFTMYITGYKCPWRKFFNIYCAGCGGTRMILALFRLDFYQAFRYNPFLFILFILVIIYGIYVLICYIIRKKYFKINNTTLIILCCLAILFMILRNIEIFSFLKPTAIRL